MKDLILRYEALKLNEEKVIKGFYVIEKTFDEGEWHILLANECPASGVAAIGIDVRNGDEE